MDDLKQIEKFITSEDCVFNLDSIDYPTRWEQQFILSYFFLRRVLQLPHSQIIRQLNSQNDKQCQQIALGFMYLFILNKNLQKLEQYTMFLRIQIWNLIGQNFEILLRQQFDNLKSGYRQNTLIIYDQLAMHNMCSFCIVGLICGNLSLIDLSKILKSVLVQIKDTSNFSEDMINTISNYLFIKIAKILPYMHSSLCLDILDIVFSSYRQKCLGMSFQVVYIVQLAPHLYLKSQFISALFKEAKQKNKQQMNVLKSEQIAFSFIPQKIQHILHFVYKQKIVGTELLYHFMWIQKWVQSKRINFQQILLDLARWAVFFYDFPQQKVMILEWICKRSLPYKGEHWQKAKKTIFHNWFIESFNYQLVICGLLLIKHFLAVDKILSAELLTYLIKFKNSHEQRLYDIFKEAGLKDHFRLSCIFENDYLASNIKENFRSLLFINSKKKEPEPLKFNPELSISSDEQAPNYNIENPEPFTYKNQEQQIYLQEQFILDFDSQLQNLLDGPSFQNFLQFFKKLTKINSEMSSKDKEAINLLHRESAKLIYCAFNNQFEDLQSIVPPSKSVINFMLSVLVKEWHQVTQKIEFIKGLVKRICQFFPTGEVAFWYYLIMQFDSETPNVRKIRSWLMPKEKMDLVVPAVQILLGRADLNLRKRLERYK